MKTALILFDIQNDFCPGGALAVPEGDAVVAIANAAMADHDLVVATQDWYPENHGSFAANNPGKSPFQVVTLDGLQQVLWPVHCVRATALDAIRLGFRVTLLLAACRGVGLSFDDIPAAIDEMRKAGVKIQ